MVAIQTAPLEGSCPLNREQLRSALVRVRGGRGLADLVRLARQSELMAFLGTPDNPELARQRLIDNIDATRSPYRAVLRHEFNVAPGDRLDIGRRRNNFIKENAEIRSLGSLRRLEDEGLNHLVERFMPTVLAETGSARSRNQSLASPNSRFQESILYPFLDYVEMPDYDSALLVWREVVGHRLAVLVEKRSVRIEIKNPLARDGINVANTVEKDATAVDIFAAGSPRAQFVLNKRLNRLYLGSPTVASGSWYCRGENNDFYRHVDSEPLPISTKTLFIRYDWYART
jgi:hypothetical protein